ncbi:PPOX class F420-dependent oxidoreductase [Nonomuraea sp. MCN248]|uniref:PPOX class F420-dependent oxidoreductase n=1 Tax=Nonomuraea corallina TaxID=2989783 RepID=A0ABT4SH68_9ACTN|nr:PPOX class F420-dependent oxidoreductase [Nonomuraea corallina]MDA0636561.1 PPOX class F420-dependent oxidoreductase [Nonomuraea corallina]
MSMTTNEIAYLNGQLLGRLATVGPAGRPHLVTVGVFYDPESGCVVIGGHEGTGMSESKKFRDAQRHPDVAFIVDDLASVDPWTPRGIEIRGRAETHTTGGAELGLRIGANMPFDPAWIRIRARRIRSWGIDTGPFELSTRDVA